MKVVSLCVLFAATAALPANAAEAPTLTPDMLSIIAGDDWTGSLTYLNYQEPFEDVTIRANVEISMIEEGVELAYKYPDEPQANSSTRANISNSGTQLMGAPIVSNEVLANDAREFKTREACEDMGRQAVCEMTYTLSETRFEIQKMVTYDGETHAFQRNAYRFER